MATEHLAISQRNDWFALFVKTGSEKRIQRKLRYLDFESISFHVPCREMRIRRRGKWVTDLQPMFPGYILVNGSLTNRSFAKAQQISDVYTWICDTTGPLRIYPEEVDLIRKLTDSEDVIRLSKVMYEGQKIIVVDGPLTGQEAIIQKVDRRKGRVKIGLSVFGLERCVDLSVENVQGIPDFG